MNASVTRTILIVEDDILTAMVERKQLEQEGYSVLHTASGEKAIEVAVNREAPVDLILMDIDLGAGIDGTEAARRILAIKDIPVVFLSSHTEKEIVQKTEQITSYGYVVKSSSFTVLDASIKMAFKLFESRKMYKRTFDHNLSGLCIHRMLFDAEGVPCDCEYLKVNNAYESQTGLSSAYLAGKTIRGIYPEGQADDVIRMYAEVFQSGVPVQKELFFEPLNRWFQISIYTIANDEFAVVVQNITDHKQTQKSLEKNHAYLHSILETMHDGFWAIDPDQCFTDVNAAYCAMSGYTRDEFLQLHIYDIDAEEKPEETDAHMQKILETGHDVFETRHRRKDGSTFLVEVSVMYLTYPERRLICFCRDVTERKRVAEALLSSESELKKAQQYGKIGSWIWHIQENRLEWSDQMFSIFGIHRDTFSGELTSVISSSIHPDDRAEVERSNESVAKLGKPIPLEYRIVRPDGVVRTVWAEAGELEKDEDGKPALLRGIVQDITDRKLVEDRIQTLLDEKQLLLKETHHRIKNDMNMIYSLLYLQANNQSNAEAGSVLMDAASRTQGMLMLYEKLYCASDYRSLGSRSFLTPLIKEIIAVLPSAAAVRPEILIDDFILSARILSRLGIILNELITNSVKYAFRGKADGLIRLAVTVEGATATIDYSDDGPGLPAETGFGLSSGFGMQLISMMVAEIAGTVELVRGSGARFLIRWPL